MTTEQLISYYTKLLESMETNRWWIGICSYINFLEISDTAKVLLRGHFRAIPRPSDAYKRAWYWERKKIDRRIEFIKEIIKTLENGTNTTD